MADKTRAQLAEENEDLKRQLAELQSGTGPTVRPAPVLPSFGLSEGTRLDILEAQRKLERDLKVNALELVEPFTGRRIRVTEDDYEVLEPDDEPLSEPIVEPAPIDPAQS